MADAKWTPTNAPLVKKDFAHAAAGPAKPAPVSKIELQRLESQRSKPAPALTPLKSNAQNPQQVVDREKRIAQIKDRLSTEKGKAREAFNKAR